MYAPFELSPNVREGPSKNPMTKELKFVGDLPTRLAHLLMSSNEDEYNNEGEGLSGLKKRRIQRACDICRRKKIRCDGVQMPGNRCSNCVSYSLDCTYIEASKKRGPPKGYVENLENRVEKLDKLLRKLLPDPTLLKELQDSIDKDRAPFNPSPLVASATQQHHGPPTNSIDPLASAIRGTSDNISPPGDIGDVETSILADNLKRSVLGPREYRFYGKSSSVMLVEAAVKLKEEYAQTLEPAIRSSETPNSSRSEFWVLQDWELSSNKIFAKPPEYVFPEPDLALELVDFYFSNINLYLPLLHRPTFEKSVAEGFHHEDERFASTYLLVCAIGARFSDDPRVLLDGDDTHHSSGWKWFNQVQMVKKSFLRLPSVYDLQFYCLSVHFLQGSSFPQSSWTMVGIGIRLAQDVAAHRRKVDQQNLTAEDELWKRGFWVLICMDRSISAALGRPCAIHDDDFDVDLPVECDDEYWDWDHPDPEQRFKQPENKPCLITAFILSIKLYQVLSYCLRTIYAINKSKILFGYVGQHWEQHIVAELDSALNKWVNSMPDHLRWDPTREGNHFKQSASLYALYYHIQILIHRPFIPTPTKPSPLSFPSLAICTNAARSCSHIAEIQRRKNPFPPLECTMAIFSAGIVLLLGIWGGKRSGLSMDPSKEMTDVHKCMKALKMYEERWRSIGRLWDILCELAEAGDLPLPQPSPLSMNKREWDSDTPRSAASSESPQPMVQDNSPRIMAGSRRVNKDLASGSTQSKRAGQSQQQSNQQQQPNQPQRHASQLPTSHLRQSNNNNRPHSDRSVTSSVPSASTFTLPVYSDELGRLPLHGHPAQSYVDQANYWYQSVPNTGGTSGGGENGINSDPPVLSNSSSLSHHSSRRQHPQTQDQLRSSHNNNTNNYSHGTNSITQGFSFNPTMGTGHVMFDPISLAYIPPASYGGVSQSTEIVSSQNPVGRPSQPPDFRGVSMALRNDLSGVPDRRQESSQPPHLEHPHHQHHHHYTQGPCEHDVHNNHQHREQQPPMGYSYEYNDTMAMWSTAPTGFELDEWGTYLSNMSGQQQQR